MARAPIYRGEGKVIEREEAAPAKAKAEAGKHEGGGAPPAAKKGLASDKGDPGKSKPAEEPVDEGGETEHPHERHMRERTDMHERHESERRDHHNNHREAMRKMHKRHEEEHGQMNERHMAELSEQAGGEVQGQEPPMEAAQGGGEGPAAAA